MKKIAKFIAYGAAALLLIVGVGVGVLLGLDGDRLKGFVAERAGEALDREVAIDGDFSTRLWSWTPRVIARDVVIANPDWASRPEMATVGEVAVRLRLKPLFAGRLEIEDLRIADADVLLETNGEQANWQFGPDDDEQEGEREDLPVVRQLLVEGARIGYRAPQLDEPVDARIDRLEVKTASYEQPVEVRGTGRFKGQDVELHGRLGAFHALRETETPYPVELAGQVGGTRLSVDGGIRRPAEDFSIDSQLSIEGQTLAELHEWLELPLPDTASYKLTGTLKQQGKTWTLTQAQANLGDSDMAGTVAFHAEETPLRIAADVTSDKLLLKDLAPFFGGEKEEPAAAQEEDRLIPYRPLALDKLQRMNVDLHFAGTVVSRGPLDVRDMEARLKLDGGRLTLDPLKFGLAEGEIRLTGRLDSTADAPHVAAGATVTGIDLGALLTVFGVNDNEAAGRIRGRLDVESKGRSLHDWASNAGGGGILVMEGGRIRNLLLEAVALDLQEALAQWASDDKSMAGIRCLAMPLQVREGRLVADPWMLDTTDALVEVRGFVDLAAEKVRLTLKPYPKDFSLFNTLTAITINGDLTERTASVDALEAAGKLALKTLAAPFMSVLSEEIEEEAKQRSPCGRLADEFRSGAESDGGSKPPEQAEQR